MPHLHSSPIRADLFDGTLSGYQRAAQTTAIYPGKGTFLGLVYTSLKLNGEAGEVAEKVGKIMRDKESILTEDDKTLLVKELGDVLWYVSAAANELGFSLNEVARRNIAKLQDRQARGTLSGSGDLR